MEPGLLGPVFFSHLDVVAAEVEPKRVLGMALRMHKSQSDAEGGRSGYFHLHVVCLPFNKFDNTLIC